MSLPTFSGLASQLTAVGRRFHTRGWALGTSGNFSVVSSRNPLRLAITASSVHKGEMADSHVLEVDETGRVVQGDGAPSAETMLHVEIVRRFPGDRCGVTRIRFGNDSVWRARAPSPVLKIEGFEMLKGTRRRWHA